MSQNKTYILKPEVPGGLGPRTQLDTCVHPPVASALHVIFDDWAGDQIVKSFPCYLITEKLAQSLASAGITGFELAEVKIGGSPEFKERNPKVTLPSFKWFKIVGNAGNDIYLTLNHDLAVSQKAFDVIMATNPTELEHEESGHENA